jgi:uncharacterized membrane protein
MRAGLQHASSRLAGTDPVAWLIALATFAAYLTISVSRYVRLIPGTWDLGIYTEYVSRFAHLQEPVVPIKGHDFNLLGDHFTPIVALIAPFFRLFPTPLTLLVAQALLTAISVVPVCRAVQDRLGTGMSRAIGAAYGFSWGLQQMVSFAFHEVAFAVPLLAFCLSALVRRRPRAAAVWALPLVFVKEDQGFTVAAIALVMLAAGTAARRRTPTARPGLAEQASAATWIRAGALLALWGPAWSLLAVKVIIPHFNPAHQYQYWNDAGVFGARGSGFSVGGLLDQAALAGPEKLRTILLLLLPVAFLALGSPLVLIAVPGLALRFLSTHATFWGTGFHYNAPLMPVMFLAAIDAMARISARQASRPAAVTAAGARSPAPPAPPGVVATRLGAGAMVLAVVGLAFSFPLSRLWQPGTYLIGPQVRAENAAMALVPDGVTVEASESMLAPLAARDLTSWIENHGIRDPAYIVFDTVRHGTLRTRTHPLQLIGKIHPGAVYRQVFESAGVYVFRRVWPPPASPAAPYRPAGATGSSGPRSPARRSALSLIPSSIFRSITRLPGSMTSMLNSRVSAEACGAAIRLRLTSLVTPSSGNRAKIHTHVPSSKRNVMTRSGSSTSTRNDGRFGPSSNSSPALVSWNSGRISSALRMPRPNRFSIQS